MPASEQVWRRPKLMHLVFGLSSVVMLVATVWMMAVDHARPWKAFQQQYGEIERWTLLAQISEQETLEREMLRQERENAIALARSAKIDVEAIEKFEAKTHDDAVKRGEEPSDLTVLKEHFHKLGEHVQKVQKARLVYREADDERLRRVSQVMAGQEDLESLKGLRESANDAVINAREARERLRQAERSAADSRDRVLTAMQTVTESAKLREDNLSRRTKFQKANLTAVVSRRDIAVGESRPNVTELQDGVDEIKADLARLTTELNAAKDHRQTLEQIVEDVVAEEEQAIKLLEATEADANRLQATLDEQSRTFGAWLIRQPVLDAFYTRKDLGIDQLWLPDLTINYNFQDVGRFDRCVTCHRAINKSAPGSALDPAYVKSRQLTLSLLTPEEPKVTPDAEGALQSPNLSGVYGMELAEVGRVNRRQVTIRYVLPDSIAARAGLRLGDVIEYIGDARILSKDDVRAYLMGSFFRSSTPLKLVIQRGVPHPFVTHPRLDLYLGSRSPHKMGEIGCTICHDGQGSATSFEWASHTPNDPMEGQRWHEKYGWFDNPHWIFPMYPQRFLESGCLKCHHEVTELEPSDRYPDPPAAKLVAGKKLVEELGCFGCHEINGYDGPERRIGPDLRAEPNFFVVAQALLVDETLTSQERDWARRLVTHPEDDAVRRRLWAAIDEQKGRQFGDETGKTPRFSAHTYELGNLLKDVESPGTLRKVGPSLRFLAAKLDFGFLYSWIRQPNDFRPTTRMPQFFGLWEHLDGRSLEQAEQFEPIEIRAIADYLLDESQPYAYLPRPASVTEEPSADRGKKLFQTRGCLACHSHRDFPDIHQDQGPDLSRAGAKFNTPKGQEWLYSWLREPSRYHVRTKMPDLYLLPIHEKDVQGKPNGKVTDPAADITAFLLNSNGWRPQNVPRSKLTQAEQAALKQLALEYLAASFSLRQAEIYLEEGIPKSLAGQLKGAEKRLLDITDANREAKQLHYVGQKSITKYGCSGCHDIPGFEGEKPIGTSLANWGRKEPSKLAFELIQQFLVGHGVDGQRNTEHSVEDSAGTGHGPNPEDYDLDTGYYLQALNGHRREGFLWQKLRMPRSYDYEKVNNKNYNERLRMPKFSVDETQIDAIATFVLGLVSEPPPEKYIYNPAPRQRALVEGRQVLDKYNCAGCHTLKWDQWEFDYQPFIQEDDPGDYEPPVAGPPEYPFLHPHVTAEEVADSLRIDNRGQRRATVHGSPMVSKKNGRPLLVDEDGVPVEEDEQEEDLEIYYQFVLWQPALINGDSLDVGDRLMIRDAAVKKYAPFGGALTRYLLPVVIAEEKSRNPQAKGSEAWGWLPPSLVDEGRKVQTEWLHDFLLDPYRIRPAVVMRMPKFNMSEKEASKVVNYFAAANGVDFPYEFDLRRRAGYVKEVQKEHPEFFADALKVITDRNYCIQCHYVGDFQPQGSPTALAPNLDQVYKRLRPDWVRNWVANPKRILPYTGMPVNIPYDKGISQQLYPGTPTQQLNGVVDFLMNYDFYTIEKTPIRPMVEQAASTKNVPPTQGKTGL